MTNKWKLSAALFACLLLAACNKEQPKAEEELPQQEAEQEEVEQEVVMPYTMPFTGEPLLEEVVQRPILATINNHPAARPQSGLGAADVVYEMLAEGDVTRLLALYQSTLPEQVGPIRSARSYFIDITKGLDAFYIAHGYSPEAKMMLQNNVVSNINGMHYDGTYFLRSRDRVAPHNSYISKENIRAGAEKVGASMNYSKKVCYTYYRNDETVKTGINAREATIRYSQNNTFNSTYMYDESSNRYKRISGNIVTTDALTNEEIQLANVLFFEMPHRIIDQVGRRDIDISGGGQALLLQNGIAREIKWKNVDGLLVALEDDGTEVKLVQGSTWVHLVPTAPGLASAVTYSE